MPNDCEYEPSPEEIAEMCLIIQSEWSETERIARAHGTKGDRQLSQADLREQPYVPKIRRVAIDPRRVIS